jgi:hypothetical protein
MAAKRVSRAAAVHKSGSKKGKLKKGCKFTKNGGAVCGLNGITKKAKKRR